MNVPDKHDLSAHAIDNAVALFGIPMQPEWRDVAVVNFATLAAAAGLVMGFPLDDEADYAPVFRP